MISEYPVLYDKGYTDHLKTDMKTIMRLQIASQLKETSYRSGTVNSK